jgi:hypothetical protein
VCVRESVFERERERKEREREREREREKREREERERERRGKIRKRAKKPYMWCSLTEPSGVIYTPYNTS